jgi:uncharacterized LabA/DUF88 family protein
MKKVVIPLSYLLGISDEICELRFREDYEPEKYAEVPWAHKVRAMMRTRQTVIFSMQGGKKFYSLNDSLRSYCPDGYFEELCRMLSQSLDVTDFVNNLSKQIDLHVEEAMVGFGIPHAEALKNTLFSWPNHSKKSLRDISTMYMKRMKKNEFPYKVFIPKPASFGTSLHSLLDSDEHLWKSPPIQLAISKEKPAPAPVVAAVPDTEVVEESSCAVQQEETAIPLESLSPNVHFIQHRFTADLLPVVAGNTISYIDFDNTPENLVSQVCTLSSVARRVKIFYDDRSVKNINTYRGMAYVDTIFVPRLKCQKSLVDTAIAVEIMKDLYSVDMTSAILFSSDSDFFPLSAAFNERGKKLIVVTLEDNVSADYIHALSSACTDTYVLSQQAVTPIIDREVVRQLLTNLVNAESIRELNLKKTVNSILAAISPDEFHHLLAKDVNDIAVELIQNAKLELVGDNLRIVFAAEQNQ